MYLRNIICCFYSIASVKSKRFFLLFSLIAGHHTDPFVQLDFKTGRLLRCLINRRHCFPDDNALMSILCHVPKQCQINAVSVINWVIGVDCRRHCLETWSMDKYSYPTLYRNQNITKTVREQKT